MSFEITLFFYPSPYGLNWKSPTSIARSSFLNQFSWQGRGIGHVHVELKGPNVHRVTGMTQKIKSEQRKLLLKQKIGLGILFHDFQGCLESTNPSVREMEIRSKKGTISFLKFLINETTFKRAELFIDDFQKLEYCDHYGLPNRPLLGEGAGCTAFAAGFLESLGLLEEEYKKTWTHYLRIPANLMGGKYVHQEFYGSHSKRTTIQHHNINPNPHVSILKLISPFQDLSWATASEPHRDIFFWDAELMDQWVRKKINNKDFENVNVAKHNKAEGIILNKTDHTPPMDSIWKENLEIKNQ